MNKNNVLWIFALLMLAFGMSSPALMRTIGLLVVTQSHLLAREKSLVGIMTMV